MYIVPKPLFEGAHVAVIAPAGPISQDTKVREEKIRVSIHPAVQHTVTSEERMKSVPGMSWPRSGIRPSTVFSVSGADTASSG